MISGQPAADARMDPWCLVPLVTGEQILFGFAVEHPQTGGLGWVRSMPIRDLNEVAGRAATASGRQYALGRRVEPVDIPLEGEEACLAYDLLIGDGAAQGIAARPVPATREDDIAWLAACKMARHLGVAAPDRVPATVQEFVKQNIDAYQQLRRLNAGSQLPIEFLLPELEPELSTPETAMPPIRKPHSPDPARIAAGCLLRRALEAAATTFEEAGRDGAVCLVVLPDVSWMKVVRDEWRAQARSGERYRNGDRDRYEEDSEWVAWTPTEPPRAFDRNAAAEAFAALVSKGRHCVGLAADVDWLPPDLVQAADYRLTLPPLAAADVTRIANLLCGHEPTERLSSEQAARLTPRLLRLARRPDQAADLYVLKLRELLRRAPAAQVSPTPATAGSPRDAPTLERLFGMEEAVSFGLGVARDIKDFKEGKITWAAVDKGGLLSGPPGCGKTLFARALAATCEVPLVTGSYSEWLSNGSGHQGNLLIAMRKTFRDARDQAPSVLFMDEIDSFPDWGKVSPHNADWEIQVVNALLSEIDGVEGLEGVVMLAACNHPERLDPALVRSGRLDHHIRIRLPDRTALARILREHLGTDLPGEDLSGAALLASGSSGADCERLVRGAAPRAGGRTGPAAG